MPSTAANSGSGSSGSPHSPIPQVSVQDDEQQQQLGNSVAFPRTLTPSQERERESRNMKRASSVSVLSGLGVRDPERILDSSSSDSRPVSGVSVASEKTSAGGGKSPSASSFAGKIRTFLGARPPSELIATHLPAYFPYTQPKVLRRTVRQSMRFSSGAAGVPGGQRDSAIVAGAGAGRRASRMSTVGRSSMALENRRESRRASMASLPPPPVPDKNRMSSEEVPRMSVSAEDGHFVDLRNDDETDGEGKKPTSGSTTPHLLPPVDFPSESFAESFHSVTGGAASTSGNGVSAPAPAAGGGAAGARSGPTPTMSRTSSMASRMSRRFSYMSELRARRDRSDTASMLTVDEITAEVELNRRKSLAASVRSGESGSTPSVAAGIAAATLGEKATEESVAENDEEKYEMIGEEEAEEGSDVDEEDEDTLDEEEDEEDEEETLANDDDQDAPVKSTRGSSPLLYSLCKSR